MVIYMMGQPEWFLPDNGKTSDDDGHGHDAPQGDLEDAPLFLDNVTAQQSRGRLSLDADLARPSVRDLLRNPLDKDVPIGDMGAKLAAAYGVKVRETNGKYELYYRAGGRDNVVASGPATPDGLLHAALDLEAVQTSKMQELKDKYKVDFAAAGENSRRAYSLTPECNVVNGNVVRATRPTLAQLYAVEDALARSQPSNLTADKKHGVKIYFLDSQLMPAPYGKKPALGVYANDKDGRPSLFITPDGAKLPPTAADAATADARNLSWVISHELTHNSQNNMWEDAKVPTEVAEALGWKTMTFDGAKRAREFAFLRAKDGGLFLHGQFDSCDKPTTWIAFNKNARPVDADGKEAKNFESALRPSNEEVGASALVRPISYYFMNPKEMHSEGLTAFRSGSEARTNLLLKSPELYKTVQRYDEEELIKFYGLNAQGLSNMVRLPSGKLAPRVNLVLGGGRP